MVDIFKELARGFARGLVLLGLYLAIFTEWKAQSDATWLVILFVGIMMILAEEMGKDDEE